MKTLNRPGRVGRIGDLLFIVLSAVALATPNASAQTSTTLYSFTGVNGDGAQPIAGLIADSSGNLFGTTPSGGLSGCSSEIFSSSCGVVFELVNSSGTYTEKILYSFTGANGDGAQPWAGLIADTSGNLYGTTTSGGVSGQCSSSLFGSDCGVVFELVNSSGTYTEKILYSFTGANGDGAQPVAGLIADSSSNLFGTTFEGGAYGGGTVFELTPPTSNGGTWTETTLYSFTGGSDGDFPFGGVIKDSSGNLYGTTATGDLNVNGVTECGIDGCGAVFELMPPTLSGGTWTETTLYSFTGSNGDGGHPVADLIKDASGNLYGTTNAGGQSATQCFPFPFTDSSGCGVVFELVNSLGTYTEKILYSFTGSSDGGNPYTFSTGLIADGSSSLYGTASLGGNSASMCFGDFVCGVVFKLTPPTSSGGNWTETVPNSFTSSDGAIPFSSLIADKSGNLYGTTEGGGDLSVACGGFFGSLGCGTVFKLSGSGFVALAGVPGTPNCAGVSTSTLAHTYGGLHAAAKALGFTSVSALQNAITLYCGGS